MGDQETLTLSADELRGEKKEISATVDLSAGPEPLVLSSEELRGEGKKAPEKPAETLAALPEPPGFLQQAKELLLGEKLSPEELEKRKQASREIAQAAKGAQQDILGFVSKPLFPIGQAVRGEIKSSPLWDEERQQLVLEGDPNAVLLSLPSEERREEIAGMMKISPRAMILPSKLQEAEERGPKLRRHHAEAALNTVVGLGRLSADVTEGLSSPANLAILGAMFLIPAVGTPRLVKALAEAGFSLSMADAAAGEIVEGYELAREGKNIEAGEKFAGSLVTASFSLLAGRGAVQNTRGYLADKAKWEKVNRAAGMDSETAKESAEVQATQGAEPPVVEIPRFPEGPRAAAETGKVATISRERELYRGRLNEPELVDKAIVFPDGQLAVPLGGTRKSGFVFFRDTKQYQVALRLIENKLGFERARIEPYMGGQIVAWGESPKSSKLGHFELGRQLGFTEESIMEFILPKIRASTREGKLAPIPERPKGRPKQPEQGVVTKESVQEALDSPPLPSKAEVLPPEALPTDRSLFGEELVRVSTEGQAGVFRIGGEKLKAVDPVVESVLTAQAKSPAVLSGLKQWFGENFIFEFNVREFPALANDLRLAKDFVFDAARASNEDVGRVVSPLTKAEYETFRRTVILRDLVDSKKRGLPVPQEDKGLVLNNLQAELIRMEKAASPAVTEALSKHQQLTDATAKSLVDRGKADESILNRPYYRHFVLDDIAGLDNFLPGLPSKLKRPSRPYTRKRVGSAKNIDTDYIDVMYRHLTKVRLDNLIEDFATKTAEKYDLSNMVPKDAAVNIFGEGGRPLPGRTYSLPDGRRAKGWQLDPGNIRYRGLTVNEKLWTEAVVSDMTVAEFANLQGPAGGAAVREGLITGGKHKVYLLDAPIADRLSRFREPRREGIVMGILAPPTRLWKRIVLDFAGIAFQLQNLAGDLLNLYREDPKALLYLPIASWAMRSNASPSLKAMTELAYNQRVIQTSGIFGGEVLGQLPNPRLSRKTAHLQGLKGELTYWNPLRWWEVFSAYRESIPRLAKFMADSDRIKRGESVVTRTVDIKGLTPIDAAGKVARNFTVDYGAVTEMFKGEIRSVLFPFATFYVENTKNWAKYVVKNPGDAAIKFGIPLAAMWTWNNTGDRRAIEAALPEWQRTIPHIITGWKTEDGKPIIVAMQTPLDMAAAIGGIDKIPMYLTDIRNGKMTKEQAAEAVVKDVVLAVPRESRQLVTPVIKVFDGLLSNRDPFTKRRIVPSGVEGSAQEKQLQIEYALEQLFTPYGAYIRSARQREPGEPLLRALTRGPFDVKRAFGIREVDLERAEMGAQYGRIDTAEAVYKTKINHLVEAYITSQVSGDNSIIMETAKRMNENHPGDPVWNSVKILPKSLIAKTKALWVQIEIRKRKLQTAKTKPEIEELERQIRLLEKQMLKRATERVPVSARPATVRPRLSFESPLENVPPPPTRQEEPPPPQER